jgi:hypothetical protein
MSGLKLAAARKPGPTQQRSSHIQAFAPLGGGVSQVVKTAQSRGRTERTLLFTGVPRGAFHGQPHGTPGQAGQAECRGQARPVTSDVTLTVCYTQLITPTSADELPVVGDSCTGGAHRCNVKQGCREDRADVWILASKVVRFGGRVQSEKK